MQCEDCGEYYDHWDRENLRTNSGSPGGSDHPKVFAVAFLVFATVGGMLVLAGVSPVWWILAFVVALIIIPITLTAYVDYYTPYCPHCGHYGSTPMPWH